MDDEKAADSASILNEAVQKTIVPEYLETLRMGIETSLIDTKDGRGLVISTPFFGEDRHLIEIHISKSKDGLRLSDMENQISELALRGLEITPRIRGIIQDTVTQYNLKLEGDEIIAIVKLNEVGKAFHNMVQAQLAVSYLIFFHERYNERTT